MAAHTTSTTVETGARYPHRATCSCGWRSTWGYANQHAARIMADDHQASAK